MTDRAMILENGVSPPTNKKPAPAARSTRPSQLLCASGPTPSLSAATPYSPAGVSNWPIWLRATQFPRSMHSVSIPKQAGPRGVVKSLPLIGAGPVGLIRTQKSHFFKTKNPLRRSKAPLLRADVHFPARVTPRPSSRARAAPGRDRDRRCAASIDVGLRRSACGRPDLRRRAGSGRYRI